MTQSSMETRPVRSVQRRSPEIHPGDPVQRRRALLLLLVFAAVAAFAIVEVREYTRDLGLRLYGESRQATLAEARTSFRIAVGLMLLPGLGLVWWVLRTAARAEAEGRFPPSGARTLRDVPIRRGRTLGSIVRVHRWLAAAILGLLIAMYALSEAILARFAA